MGCCSAAKWQREKVADHKFDYVDIRDFHDSGCFSQLRYVWVYIVVLKSFLVYVSDTYTAIAMLASNHWSGSIIAQSGDSSVARVPFNIGKWIFVGCIIFSFLLLLWEARKARSIIRSRDISYAYTNVMANNYYCLKSYDHFCFFSEISNSKRRTDDLAFFVFFTFKGWKRLLLADSPRQVINGLTLFAFLKAKHFTTDISQYVEGSWVRAVILCTMCFTVVICAGSLVLMAIAAMIYIPLLCHIRGNLKEFCCHKVDKRIDELMRRKARSRQAQEAARLRKEAAGDFTHLQDKRGKYLAKPGMQPTLPVVELDDDEMYARSDYGSRKAAEAGFYQGQTYPPVKYDFDAPAPQPSYTGSELSLSSYERYGPYDAHAPLNKAPSYRSQASSEQDHYWSPEGAPPVPPLAEDYFQRQPTQVSPQHQPQQHARQATEEELYEPIRRTALFQRSGAELPFEGRPGSRTSDAYGAGQFDLDAYHRSQ